MILEATRSVASALFATMSPGWANEIEFNSVFPGKSYEDIAKK